MAYLKHGDPIPTVGRGSRLTGLQLRVVENFTDPSSESYQNWSRSVVLAGYKTRNPNKIGIQLSQHPLIIEEVRKRMDARLERHELNADYVINKLMTLVENTLKDSDRIRALELLGKTMAIFKERQEVSGPDGEAIKYEQKVRENVDGFTSKLSRLVESQRAGNVVELPKRVGEG